MAATTGKDYPLEHYALARALEKVSDWSEAAEEYKRFLSMDPEPSQYTRHAERRLEELDQASSTEASPAKPTPDAPSPEDARELLREGDFDQASGLLARLPETQDTLNMKGLVAMQRGELEEAEKTFQRSLALGEDHAPTLINLAVLTFRKGCLNAADLLERAARNNPCDPTPLFDRGLCLLRAGRLSQAKEAFANALTLDPSDEEARSLLEQASRGQ